ncbi:hypothetical protein ACHAXH_004803 [Discostella pseudostelligera]
MDPNDNSASRFELYDESRRVRQSSINPLIGEFDDHFLDAEHDSNTFRRRRFDGNHHQPSTSIVDAYGSENVNQMQTSLKVSQHLTWNKLNTTLFVGLALMSAATSTSITLIPSMSLAIAATSGNEEWDYSPYYNLEFLEVYDGSGKKKQWIPFRIRSSSSRASNNYTQDNISSSSIFASHLTSVVTLVTAFGKFINGILVDIAGARRLLLIYGLCTCLALVGLKHCTTPNGAIACSAAVEFFSSINWSAGIVILGAHYGSHGNESDGTFERGLHVTSLACRCGSLLAIPLSSLLMKWTDLAWRDVAGLAAWAAFGGVAVFYFYLSDSPGKVHDPQNPIRTLPNSIGDNDVAHRHSYHPSFHSWTPIHPTLSQRALNFISSVYHTAIPSIRAILLSRVFWVVAAAHAGATMVKSSERILGTYFRDTSYGVVTESKAGAMTMFLSLGMLAGLLAGGKAFARATDSEQRTHTTNGHYSEHRVQDGTSLAYAAQIGTKNMIAFFYCLSICMCYTLSFCALPVVRKALHLPVLVLVLQVMATLGLGFGVAVQYYHIPAIVSAAYGKNRGLYTAYTEGVAALVSSIVWRIVGGAVEEGNPQGGGWAYGWAAVALLLIFCGTLMVSILEVYFVGGGWCHDTPKGQNESAAAAEPTIDIQRGWLDDEYSMNASPLRKPGRLNALSSSALEFIGSPGRIHVIRQKSLLVVDDSHDEEGSIDDNHIDLLGIDDDGSFLIPSSNIATQHEGLHNLDLFNLPFGSMKKEIRVTDGSIRESSVFDDQHDGQYNRDPFQSFEL